MGNIVLLFGITFLTQYLMNLGHQVVAVIIGLYCRRINLCISEYLKKSNIHLSFMFKMNAQVLLFYVTLRLHFFSPEPLIANKIGFGPASCSLLLHSRHIFQSAINRRLLQLWLFFSFLLQQLYQRFNNFYNSPAYHCCCRGTDSI